MLRVRRDRKSGWLTVTMRRAEGMVLRRLPEMLRAILLQPDAFPRIHARLFPKAYKDAEKEFEFRRLLGGDLLDRKFAEISAFERTLEGWKSKWRRVTITLRPEDFDLWLGFVNDMRLTLGTLLGIEKDGWGEDFDPDAPRAAEMALLHYLSLLEERLLEAQGFCPAFRPENDDTDRPAPI